MKFSALIAGLANRAGYEIRRLDSARRSQLLRHHGVDLVLDVGAAVGKYALELRRFGYEGKIISFEPLDDAFASLQEAARNDPGWDAVHCAVGDADVESVIHVAGNSDSSSLLKMLDRTNEVAPHARYVGSQWVSVRRLDHLVADELTMHRAPFLKIDTQGYERAVLDGAAAIIPDLCGIQIELSFVHLYEGDMLVDEAINSLLAAGFQLQGIEPGLRDPGHQQLLQADGIFFRY